MKKEVENPEHKFPQANDNFSANHCTKKDLQNSLIDLTNDLLYMYTLGRYESQKYQDTIQIIGVICQTLNALRK